MSEYEIRFWRENTRYHDLVEHFDRNIERVHPPYVTSERMCGCLEYCSWCGWAASTVDYYEYRGEAV